MSRHSSGAVAHDVMASLSNLKIRVYVRLYKWSSAYRPRPSHDRQAVIDVHIGSAASYPALMRYKRPGATSILINKSSAWRGCRQASRNSGNAIFTITNSGRSNTDQPARRPALPLKIGRLGASRACGGLDAIIMCNPENGRCMPPCSCGAPEKLKRNDIIKLHRITRRARSKGAISILPAHHHIALMRSP